MGWKSSMILINSTEEFDKNEFFGLLGYYDLEKTDNQYFEEIMNPEEDVIYLGKYNGNTIICMQDLPLESLATEMSKAESLLSKRFLNSDIVTFVLHSVVNLWGYSIVKNGNKVRVRAGSSEGGTTVEHGEILAEEKELFSQSKLNEDGKRIFIFDGLPDDAFSEDQVGENFVFDISQTYLDDSLDDCGGLFQTEFEGYAFSKNKPEPIPVPIKNNDQIDIIKEAPKKEIKKPWWKFW